jgi:hypothetical protein
MIYRLAHLLAINHFTNGKKYQIEETICESPQAKHNH